MDDSEKLALSVEETANALGVSRAFAFKLVLEGAIPSLKIGKRRLVPVAGLREYVERQTAEAQVPT